MEFCRGEMTLRQVVVNPLQGAMFENLKLYNKSVTFTKVVF